MQINQKHTPGPWQAIATDPAEGWDGWEIKAQPSPALRGFTAIVASATGPQREERCEADAKLIAAAPTMFNALRTVLEAAELGDIDACHEAARQAILKAT